MSQISPAQIKELREKTGAGFGDCKSALAESNGNVDEAVTILRKKGLAAASKKAGRITSEGLVFVHSDDSTAAVVEMNSETDFVANNPEFRELVRGIAEIAAKSNVDSVEQLVEQLVPGDAENRTVAQLIASFIGRIGENLSLRRFARIPFAGKNSAVGTYVHGNGRIGVLVEISYDKPEARAIAESTARDLAMHVAAAEPRYLNRTQVTESDLATEREVARDQAAKSGKPENIVEKMVSGKMEKFYGEAVLLEQPYIRDDKQTVTQYVNQRAKEAGATFEVTRFERFKVGEGLQKRDDDFAAEVAAQAGL
jgi:elongation factor Ts